MRLVRPVLARLPQAVLISLGVSLIAFGILRLSPGDPVLSLLGEEATLEEISALRSKLGLDGSILSQYWRFLSGVFRGDFGESLQTHSPVLELLVTRLPPTISLVSFANSLAILLAVPIGLFVGVSSSPLVDNVFRVIAAVVLAVPVFVTAVMLLIFFSVHLEWLPVAGFEPGFPGNIRTLLLPAISVALPTSMVLARVLQSAVRDTKKEEFFETAVIWGLPRRTIYMSYLLKPSFAPTIGLLAYIVGASLAGGVIIETVFNLPGVGSFLVRSMLARDYPVVQGVLFFFGIVIVILSFVFDVIAAWIDPRIQISK